MVYRQSNKIIDFFASSVFLSPKTVMKKKITKTCGDKKKRDSDLMLVFFITSDKKKNPGNRILILQYILQWDFVT